ncbi:MAG: 50S ribosomal protein L20 [Vicinamibacteraceae bacterium]
MRVKRGAHRRQQRKKTLSLAKGYFGAKGRLYRYAKEAVERAGRFAYVGRRRKKRDFRRLWVIRVNAAARQNGITYGQLIAGLKSANVPLDRKVLADLAVNDPQAFAAIASLAKQAPSAPEASA